LSPHTGEFDDRSLPGRLAARLGQPRPVRDFQARFAPRLSYGRHRGPTPSTARPAAVMVLFYPRGDRWHIPLTLRPRHLHDHGGQISLPGGRLEEGESYREAACRELHEELGVPARDLEMIGHLSPTYVYASNFRVESIVAVVRARPRFRLEPLEVDEVIELPVGDLVNPAHYGVHEIRRGGLRFTAPHVACGEHRIWGATAVMLGELIGVLNQLGPE